MGQLGPSQDIFFDSPVVPTRLRAVHMAIVSLARHIQAACDARPAPVNMASARSLPWPRQGSLSADGFAGLGTGFGGRSRTCSAYPFGYGRTNWKTSCAILGLDYSLASLG